MYLRKVVRGQRIYWDLVEGVRDPRSGKVLQRMVAHLGRDEELRPKLESLHRSLAKLAESPLIDPRQVSPEAAREIGGVWVLDQLWRELGMDQILAESSGAEAADACFAIVASRILAPRSKLATSRWLTRNARPDGGEWDLDYHQLLRAMDAVAGAQKQIEERVYWQLVDLLQLDLTLVFVDLTSVYVEGEGLDPLWQYGVSKDGKRQNKQLLLALVVTPDGYPLAHFLFPGNRAEKVAVLEMLVELRQRYKLQRCVIVGDRGLISATVVRALSEAGYEYILSLRARQSKTASAALDQDADQWEAIDDNLFVQEVKLPDQEARVLLALNDEKQEIDRGWREQLLDKAWAALDGLLERWQSGRLKDEQTAVATATRALVQLDAHKFFRVRVTKGVLEVSEREDQLAKEARLDGVFVLQSTATGLPATEIVNAYKQLLAVERAFRTLKSFLRVRPVFHFSERRIRAHFLLCILAYLLENHLNRRLDQAQAGLSARAALEALETLKVVDYELPVPTSRRIRVFTKPTLAALAVIAALGFKLPRQLTLPTAA
jgi:hypothetical protein